MPPSGGLRERRLASLRRRLSEIDREILRLVGERSRLARAVGALKAGERLPVRVYEVEARVLERWKALAPRFGVEAGLARELARKLIAASVREQESQRPMPARRPLRISVLGGAGRMGSWLCRFFSSQGHEVTVHDPGSQVPFPQEPDLAAAVREADVVVLATPLRTAPAVLRRVLALKPRGLVFDVFSLKSHVLGLLKTAAGRGLKASSVHPLFGPGARTLAGRVVAVCDCGSKAAARQAAGLFRDTALSVVRLPVEGHDAFMQYVLGLGHLINLLFVHTLLRSGVPFPRLERLGSTTFQKQARTAREVAFESAALYYDIQHLNTHSRGLYRLVDLSLRELKRAALSKNPRRFLEIMQEGRAYFPRVLREELD